MNLKRKIESYQAKIGIVGLGYVGLPLATKIAEAGFQVTGYDINKEKVDLVNSGNSYIPDLSSQKLMNLTKLNKIVASTNARFFSNVDIICICVPTPLDKTKTPDITHIISVSQTIAHYLQKEQIVILESTTYPGTTSVIILPILEKTGLKVGRDFFLAFSPERMDPGNKTYHIGNTPKIVGGETENCVSISRFFYQHFVNLGVFLLNLRVKCLSAFCRMFDKIVKLVTDLSELTNVKI